MRQLLAACLRASARLGARAAPIDSNIHVAAEGGSIGGTGEAAMGLPKMPEPTGATGLWSRALRPAG